jgi:methyl-accepting chemotaxis protein
MKTAKTKSFTRPTIFQRTFLVNPHFQYRFIAFAALTALAACTFFYVANSYFFYKYTRFAIEAGLQPEHPFFKVLSNMEDLMTLIFGITSLVIISFTTVAGLVFSNRVAGPLLRLVRHFERVARGETMGGISFRQGDYFEDVAESYNRQMTYLRENVGDTQKVSSIKAKKVS